MLDKDIFVTLMRLTKDSERKLTFASDDTTGKKSVPLFIINPVSWVIM